MLFYIFTFFSGFVLILAGLILVRFFSKKWNLPRSLFWRAGFYHVLVSFLYFGVIGNLNSVFPAFENLSSFFQTLIIGVIAGLFIELGRFVIIDRLALIKPKKSKTKVEGMIHPKKVRSFKSGVFFGLGWGAVNALLIGVMAIFNTFGAYYLVQVNDFKTQFPEASQQEIQILEEAKKEIQKFSQGNPLIGLTPIVENATQVLVDIALTLLIIFGIKKAQSRFTWMAAGLRIIFSTATIYLLPLNQIAGEIVVVIFGAMALGGILILQKKPELNV